MFLAVAAVLVAVVWQRRSGSRAAWPLALFVVLFLPQFLLPSIARMAFGIAAAVAAGAVAVSAARAVGLSEPTQDVRA